MQIDIGAHIEKLLFEHETLIVPNFGGFTATRSPAAVDFVGGTIAPPTKTLAFNENLTVDDGILVHDVSHTHGISTEDARHAILDFVENTKNALAQREIVTLPGIGRLYKNYAQKVQFLPDTTNFNTESYGLPPLQFSPIARARENAEPAPYTANGASTTAVAGTTSNTTTAAPPPPVAPAPQATVPPPVAPEIERTQNRNPMRSMAAFGVALLVFALAVAVYFMNQRRKALLNKTATTEQVEDTPLSTLPAPGEMMGKAEQEEAAQKAAAEKQATADNDKTDDKEDDITDDVEEATAKKIEASKAKSSASVAKEKTKAAPKEEESKPLPGEGKRCVLIIGTYKQKENAVKLVDKLKGAGYDTYYRIQKGHQVGIEFNYKEMVEIQDKIKALQKLTGEQDIWIKKK